VAERRRLEPMHHTVPGLARSRQAGLMSCGGPMRDPSIQRPLRRSPIQSPRLPVMVIGVVDLVAERLVPRQPLDARRTVIHCARCSSVGAKAARACSTGGAFAGKDRVEPLLDLRELDQGRLVSHAATSAASNAAHRGPSPRRRPRAVPAGLPDRMGQCEAAAHATPLVSRYGSPRFASSSLSCSTRSSPLWTNSPTSSSINIRRYR